jgi:hypothetical protein
MSGSAHGKHWRSAGGAARERDAFYTKPAVAQHCVAAALRVLAANGFVPVAAVEPAAGDGAFVVAIRAALPAAHVAALDVAPAAAAIATGSFYDATAASLGVAGVEAATLVATNPPFGKNASDAVRFFNHAAALGIGAQALIVPRTFRKPSIVARLDTAYHIIHEEDVPTNAFRFRAADDAPFTDYDVPTVLQVWCRRAVPRAAAPPRSPSTRVLYVEKAARAGDGFCDAVVQRVGVAAGRVSFDAAYIAAKRTSGNYYFVRFADADLLAAAHAETSALSATLEALPCKRDCAGMPSISRGELSDGVEAWFAARTEHADARPEKRQKTTP